MLQRFQRSDLDKSKVDKKTGPDSGGLCNLSSVFGDVDPTTVEHARELFESACLGSCYKANLCASVTDALFSVFSPSDGSVFSPSDGSVAFADQLTGHHALFCQSLSELVLSSEDHLVDPDADCDFSLLALRQRAGSSLKTASLDDTVARKGGPVTQAVNQVQAVANEVVDNVQTVVSIEPLNQVVDAAQGVGNGAIDGAQAIVDAGFDASGHVVDTAQTVANDMVDGTQAFVPLPPALNGVIDGVQSAGNDLLNNAQYLTGIEVDNDWVDRTNYHRLRHGACPVVWNQGLADAMLAYLNTLPPDGWSMEHDPNRGDQIGENLAGGRMMTPVMAVDAWYSEVDLCSPPPSSPGCLGEWNYDTGHYTALVWKPTDSIGCAILPDGRNGCRYASNGYGVAEGGSFESNVGGLGEVAANCPVLTALSR